MGPAGESLGRVGGAGRQRDEQTKQEFIFSLCRPPSVLLIFFRDLHQHRHPRSSTWLKRRTCRKLNRTPPNGLSNGLFSNRLWAILGAI